MENFSVLMSLYIKETAQNFTECMESVLNQTIVPSEIVIVEDGPINYEVNDVINKYITRYPEVMKLYKLQQNQGLGLALRYGVEKCTYDLIARMDTDDICRSDRFEKQLLAFKGDEDLKIVGSYIAEFEGNKDNILSQRKVPLEHEQIIKYQKRRSAFNHVSVMFRKNAVIDAGNYEDALYMEDDVLWSRMLLKDMKSKNLPDDLVYVRTGLEMIKRRGGNRYLGYYKSARKTIFQMGFISYWDYFITVFIQVIVCYIPKSFRAWIFKNILR